MPDPAKDAKGKTVGLGKSRRKSRSTRILAAGPERDDQAPNAETTAE